MYNYLYQFSCELFRQNIDLMWETKHTFQGRYFNHNPFQWSTVWKHTMWMETLPEATCKIVCRCPDTVTSSYGYNINTIFGLQYHVQLAKFGNSNWGKCLIRFVTFFISLNDISGSFGTAWVLWLDHISQKYEPQFNQTHLTPNHPKKVQLCNNVFLDYDTPSHHDSTSQITCLHTQVNWHEF